MSEFSNFALGFFGGAPVWLVIGAVETVIYSIVRERLRYVDPDDKKGGTP